MPNDNVLSEGYSAGRPFYIHPRPAGFGKDVESIDLKESANVMEEAAAIPSRFAKQTFKHGGTTQKGKAKLHKGERLNGKKVTKTGVYSVQAGQTVMPANKVTVRPESERKDAGAGYPSLPAGGVITADCYKSRFVGVKTGAEREAFDLRQELGL